MASSRTEITVPEQEPRQDGPRREPEPVLSVLRCQITLTYKGQVSDTCGRERN